MGKFLEREKRYQAKVKASSLYFSNAARADGIYKGKPRPFCLPIDHAEENLFHEIRETSLTYFASQGIKWHDGRNGKPSNHLCDSQVCCVNFLFPFEDKPAVLAELMRPIFPAIREMLPIENGQYVAFEWIGQENYLGEKISHSGKRTRGANFTSADAAIMFERTDGKQQVVLIEWKYTESYGGSSLKISKSGTDRTSIYRPLFQQDDCPINRNLLPNFEALFYEPFYQLMRQQFLAHEMERAQELGADIVCVLHITPDHNADFRRVTSPDLAQLGDTVMDVWKKLVQPRDRFISISTERLFNSWLIGQLLELRGWSEYINTRYIWIQDSTMSPS